MATNPFHESTSTMPKSDPQVERIEFDKEDIGARKSQLARAYKGKNAYTLRHVKGS